MKHTKRLSWLSGITLIILALFINACSTMASNANATSTAQGTTTTITATTTTTTGQQQQTSATSTTSNTNSHTPLYADPYDGCHPWLGIG